MRKSEDGPRVWGKGALTRRAALRLKGRPNYADGKARVSLLGRPSGGSVNESSLGAKASGALDSQAVFKRRRKCR